MSLYSIVGHPLLRCPSGVSPAVLEEQARVAERVLGLVGTDYTGDDARDAARAVVLQVNDQLNGQASGLKSETHGIETWVYSGDGVAINALAAEIVADLAAAEAEDSPAGLFPAVTSFR